MFLFKPTDKLRNKIQVVLMLFLIPQCHLRSGKMWVNANQIKYNNTNAITKPSTPT